MRSDPVSRYLAESGLARELAANRQQAEEELSALLAQSIRGEPPASSDAMGLEPAWRAVEEAGGGAWRVLSLERIPEGWQAAAVDERGEVLVVVARVPALALMRLARAVRESTKSE